MSRTDSPSPVRTPRPVSLESWVSTTRALLSLEQQEEIETMRNELTTLSDSDNPNVLTRLTLAHCSTGLFGRTLFQFAFPSRSLKAPKSHHFTVGDLVQIRLQKTIVTSAKLPTGIVSRVEDQSISIAVNNEHDDVDEVELLSHSGTITLDRLVNTATYTKLTGVLDQLSKYDYQAAQSVVDVVFFNHQPKWKTPLPPITLFNTTLNESQVEAIQFALASNDIALIHGPPGTGKTTTIVELILQAVLQFHLKVLVCAPSNIAVDNVLEKVATTCAKLSKKLHLTRIGHPARVLPQILHYCLDAKIQVADGTDIVKDIRQEMATIQSKLLKSRDKSLRFQLRREMKLNRKEIREREQKVVGEIVHSSDVVFATNVGAASKLLKDVTFDVVVIDEAAQALEVSCWVPILKARRCVLAGDHLQLPPTIKSKKAAAKGLDRTLFDRLSQCDMSQQLVKMLKIQYRMHENISDWSSHAMYKGELKSFDRVAKRKLHELSHTRIAKEDDVLNATLLLLDTAGCDLEEDTDTNSEEKSDGLLSLSKSNEGEARVVAKHVRALLQAGLKEDDVAVITPYNKQVQVLKALLLDDYPKLEIRSVDGFQGCEKEAVVMSLVRSNALRQVGFLADDRRMNVAITRAKRHVAVVCDTDTISSHTFLADLVHHFETFGEYRSAQEYLNQEVVEGNVEEAVLASLHTSRKPAVAAVSQSKPAKVYRAKAVTQKGSPKAVKTNPVLASESVGATMTIAVDQGDEESEESGEEIQDKKVTSKSVFQMIEDDSESSDDDEQDHSQALGEEDKGGLNSSTIRDDVDVPAANSLLKDLHLSRLARQSIPPIEPSSGKKKSKKKKKNKNKVKNCTTNVVQTVPIDEVQEGEDELEFLTRQADKNKSCAFQNPSRCKKKTTILGDVCKYCKLKFCYTHALPEEHGCGDAARKFERAAFQQQPTRSSNSKKLTGDKRKQLKKKLNEKVSAQTANRTTQLKSKKQ